MPVGHQLGGVQHRQAAIEPGGLAQHRPRRVRVQLPDRLRQPDAHLRHQPRHQPSQRLLRDRPRRAVAQDVHQIGDRRHQRSYLAGPGGNLLHAVDAALRRGRHAHGDGNTCPLQHSGTQDPGIGLKTMASICSSAAASIARGTIAKAAPARRRLLPRRP